MAASKRFCTFTLDEYWYGVEVQYVREVLQGQPLTSVPLAPEHVAGLINLRGEIMMVVDLRRRLGLPERSQDQKPFHLVMYGNDGCISLLVDKVGDVVELDEQDFEEIPEVIQGLARQLILGAYKSESGILLSIDPEKATDVSLSMNKIDGGGTDLVTQSHGKSADDPHHSN